MKRDSLWPSFAPLLLLLSACSDRAAEPDRPPAATTRSDPTSDASGEPVVTTNTPIAWDVPAGWTMTETSDKSARRAGYSVPRVGDDKEDAELLVLYFGRGPNAERDKQWDAWFEQFDGNAKKDATRGTLTAGDAEIETFEFVGSYKLNMGPQRPGMKRSPVQMVKKDFRMIGAFVKTKDKGNWFVRLVGPDKTVTAAKDPLVQMLKSIR